MQAQPGPYEVSCEFPGFRRAVRGGLVLETAARRSPHLRQPQPPGCETRKAGLAAYRSACKIASATKGEAMLAIAVNWVADVPLLIMARN